MTRLTIAALAALALVCVLASSRANQHSVSSLSRSPHIDQLQTTPDESRDAVWHAAVERSVLPIGSVSIARESVGTGQTVPIEATRPRPYSTSNFSFSRPHDPPHLHAFSLLI